MRRSDGKYAVVVKENNKVVIELVYDEGPTMEQVGEDLKSKAE